MKKCANLQRHLCVFIENGHIKHQPSEQMLQHGGSKVPVTIIKLLHEKCNFLK